MDNQTPWKPTQPVPPLPCALSLVVQRQGPDRGGGGGGKTDSTEVKSLGLSAVWPSEISHQSVTPRVSKPTGPA